MKDFMLKINSVRQPCQGKGQYIPNAWLQMKRREMFFCWSQP